MAATEGDKAASDAADSGGAAPELRVIDNPGVGAVAAATVVASATPDTDPPDGSLGDTSGGAETDALVVSDATETVGWLVDALGSTEIGAAVFPAV
jgi:hypothetical protein